MKEHPILFSSTMVRAIRTGRKTMTRRIVCASMEDHPEAWSAFTVASTDRKCRNTWSISKPDPKGRTYGTPPGTSSSRATELWRGRCKYGEPGDRLWVRETHSKCATSVYPCPATWYRADFCKYDDPALCEHIDGCSGNRADCFACVAEREGKFKWKPAIFMPRRESRITLEITNVRIERLQSISAVDILAEGAVLRAHNDDNLGKCPISAFDGKCYVDLLSLWAAGWNSINGKRAPWKSNPWVWVIEFKPSNVDRYDARRDQQTECEVCEREASNVPYQRLTWVESLSIYACDDCVKHHL